MKDTEADPLERGLRTHSVSQENSTSKENLN